MALLESQLATWSHQGSITNSANTYESIKKCVDSINWNPDIKYEIYLQGSYKNSTNIYGNSDVDIVVEFTSIFSSDTSQLDSIGIQVHNSLKDAEYNLDSFKKAIVEKLQTTYSNSVQVGAKSIKIKGNSSRLDADVIVCNSYKKYRNNNGSRFLSGDGGILFYNNETFDKVINYPKIHYDNGVAKNSNERTNSNYKSTVRIFRNIKAYLVDNSLIKSDVAPSYFVECLIYNVKDEHFRASSYQSRVFNVLSQLTDDINNNLMIDYTCQNHQVKLFGTSEQQWNINNAKIFLAEIVKLWRN